MKPLTIVGGGIAGLTLGIGLRLRGVPVTLWEAGQFPRHRVCGEFISGRGHAVLRDLELDRKLIDSGARLANTATFYGDGRSCGMKLFQPAVAYSRFGLDQLLARTFQELGGGLKENCRWKEIGSVPVVHATGRRAQVQVNGWRWFGLKAHACDVELKADLELHLFADAYIGLCRVENGLTNVCGLFRSRRPISEIHKRWRDLLRGAPDSDLARHTEAAEFDPSSFCATAALSFRPQWKRHDHEFRIGDAFAAIAPLAGNGISLALESAGLALDPLERFSRAKIDWNEALHTTMHRLTRAFGSRLRLAWWIQQALFSATCRRVLIPLFGRHAPLRRLLFNCTR